MEGGTGIMILKLGNLAGEAKSFSPISLLSIISKTIQNVQWILDNQFDFKQDHSIIKQGYRSTSKIWQALGGKSCSLATFLDVEQAYLISILKAY